MDAKRILVLMDNRADSNWGSQATTHALYELLRRQYPRAEIRGLPRSVVRPKTTLQRRAAEALGPRFAVRDSWHGLVGRRVLAWLTASWSGHLCWADLIVLNGEGTLHPQRQASRWMSVLAALPTLTKSPLWVVNCSIQVRGHPHEGLFRAALSRAARVVVREPCSAREMEAMDLPAELAADCAFLARGAPKERAGEILSRLGIEDPFAILTGSASVRNWPLNTQAQHARLLLGSGLKVLYATSTEEDRANYLRLQRECPLPLVTHKDATHEELHSIIAKSRLLVGGRFHLTIFAAATGTPFVAVEGGSHKFAGLMEMLKSTDALFAMDDEEGQLRGVERAIEQSGEIGATLRTRAAMLAESAVLNVRPGGMVRSS